MVGALLRRSALAALLAATLAAASLARPAVDAASFVSAIAREAISDLGSASTPEAQRVQRLREIVNDSFDVQVIARFVLGRYWRQASEAERAEFTRLFDQLIVQTYTRRFTEFNAAQFRILSTSPPNEDNDVIVALEGALPRRPPVRLDVRVRQNSGDYRIIDVAIEGVSMAVSQSEEFASVIQRGGGRVEALLASLRARVEQR